MRSVTLGMFSLLLVGCGGGGGDGGASSSCNAVGGSANAVFAGGSADNVDAVADGNLGTFSTFDPGPAGSGNYIDAGRSTGSAQFPAGSNAGVFVSPPSGLSTSDITVGTFVDQVSQGGESATGPALTITQTHGDPATEYISFNTTVPFNGVKLTVNKPGAGTFLVYEFCGAASVR